MPLAHLCLPPQIELFDAGRRHATTHNNTHSVSLRRYSVFTRAQGWTKVVGVGLCPWTEACPTENFIVEDDTFIDLSGGRVSRSVTTKVQLKGLGPQPCCAIISRGRSFHPHRARIPQGDLFLYLLQSNSCSPQRFAFDSPFQVHTRRPQPLSSLFQFQKTTWKSIFINGNILVCPNGFANVWPMM